METQETIFRFIYQMALRDATLEKAFPVEKKHLKKNTEARELLRAYTDKIWDNSLTEADFDETEKKLEASFKTFLKGSSVPFTFGNTQKLINMTAKYLYITVYRQPDLRAGFRYCHCPMDSRIVEYVIKDLDALDTASLSDKEQEEFSVLTEKGYKTFLRRSWSRITSDDTAQYDHFQRAVRLLCRTRGILPIEYDYLFWK